MLFERLRTEWALKVGGYKKAVAIIGRMQEWAYEKNRPSLAMWLDQWLEYMRWYRESLPDYAYSDIDLLGFPSYRWYWFGPKAFRIKMSREPVFCEFGFCGVQDGEVLETVLMEWDADGLINEMILYLPN